MVWSTIYDQEVSTILPGDPKLPVNQGKCKQSNSCVDYLSNLDINSRAKRMRLSGIVCTIGPASKDTDYLVQMIETGMNVARLNFSHGSYEYHGETIANVRAAVEKYKEKHGVDPCVAIALDTKGPEIRTGLLEGDDGRKEIALQKGASIKLTTDESFKEKCTGEVLYVDYKNITKVIEVGKRIFIDDGLISVVAKEIGSDYVVGEIENGGNLGSRKGCNLPGTDCDLPAVSEKDKKDLLFGVEQGVDMVFASFIRDAAGVKEMRKILGENILILPKIENQQGINYIDEIIAESDGIMVARGDMGIEIPTEKVFVAQKQIIAKCNKAGKPVICATQMLESMVKKPRPTRAEGADVANAILDGADCTMLSGESAKGDYPLVCVKTMGALAREAEAVLWNQWVRQDMAKQNKSTLDTVESTALSAVEAASSAGASALIAVTSSGRTARLAAKYRPECPILAVTRNAQVARQLQLSRGVVPVIFNGEDSDWQKDVSNRVEAALNVARKCQIVAKGDKVVTVTGWRRGKGSCNNVRIMDVE